MLSSVVSNSNSTSIRGTSKELKSDDSPMVADEKAIQDAYQEALVDEGVSDIIDRMKKEQADYIKWFDNYFSAAESYTDDYAELDYDKYHKRLADYECIKSKSENAHFENDKQLQVYNECNEELLRKICEVRQEGVSDEILNEAVVLANDTLNLAETNKLLASELVAVDKERKTKIEDIQDMLDIIRIAATEDIEYWLNDLPYEFANDAATISNSVNQLKVIETEIKLEEKAQYWSKDLVESYIPGASYWEKFDYNDASEIEGIYHIMQYYNDLVLGENVYSNIIKTLE